MKDLRIIVTGLIGQFPLGGITWHYLQYILGLERLGHDVFYFEDTGQWPYNPKEGGVSKAYEFNVRYLSDTMSHYNLDRKWAYRVWHSKWFGLSDQERNQIIQSTDLLINVSGSLAFPKEYRNIPRMIYIDTDPVFTQLKLARGQEDFRNFIDVHDIHFSFGELMHASTIFTGHTWLATRQPIVLSAWQNRGRGNDSFTTIMNWTSYKPIIYEGITYGQKDMEFKHFLDLPSRVPETVLELAVNAGKTRRTPRQLLKRKGWRLVDPCNICPDLDSYRNYIETSKAEWSVAKNGYVAGRSGWFSERSACYLAAGKPVIVQDTGFTSILPWGEGILPFRTREESLFAIQSVEAEYDKHSFAARSIAEDYFDSDKVLARLINDSLAS